MIGQTERGPERPMPSRKPSARGWSCILESNITQLCSRTSRCNMHKKRDARSALYRANNLATGVMRAHISMANGRS